MTELSVAQETARIHRSLRGRYDPEAGCCVTLVAVGTVADVLAAFGAEPHTVERTEVEPGLPVVSAVEVPGGVAAFEDDGFQAALGLITERLSTVGPTGAMNWNGIGDAGLVFTRDGVHSGPGDGIFDGQYGDDPAEVALFAGLEGYDTRVRGLRALERFTGVRLDVPPADPPARVHRFLPPLPAPRSSVLPSLHGFVDDPPN